MSSPVGWDKFTMNLTTSLMHHRLLSRGVFMPAYKTGVRGRPKKTFAYMVKSRRITRGYSQKQLAALLDIDHTYVSHWENGRRYPNVAILHDLVETLEYNDKEVRWLLKTLAEGKL